MQAIFETAFDAAYLISILSMGAWMTAKSGRNRQYRLFGFMAIVLGAGDAFHLAPRAYALCTVGLDQMVPALGTGKLITSLTMTVFYVLLYHVWRLRYRIQGRGLLTAAVYALAALRIALCLFPQNQWLSSNPPLAWGIYRNLPFAALGLLVLLLFRQSAVQRHDRAFRWMWLTIALSFAFYIPVVLWADSVPLVGMLMIPKTCAYVWAVATGFWDMRKETGIPDPSIKAV